MTVPAETITLADKRELEVEVVSSDGGSLLVAVYRQGAPAPALVLALPDAKELAGALHRVVEIAERAAAEGRLRLDP
ncbi:MAG TPA: hypothetical protein VGI95_17300 [Caulobacteraceae bacterium]